MNKCGQVDCNCNAWFTFSLRTLFETFEELWTRRGTHECRHSHFCARTTRQVQLSKVTRQARVKKKIPVIKIAVKGSRTEQECNHSTFDSEARHSQFFRLGTDLPTHFYELWDETRTGRECDRQDECTLHTLVLVSCCLDENVNQAWKSNIIVLHRNISLFRPMQCQYFVVALKEYYALRLRTMVTCVKVRGK